ncbi:MAG: diacylglycerol kinase [Nitriliruptorales bacterium]|nr:diacylglycerol kinase [Nitriliruptorales bacterium]
MRGTPAPTTRQGRCSTSCGGPRHEPSRKPSRLRPGGSTRTWAELLGDGFVVVVNAAAGTTDREQVAAAVATLRTRGTADLVTTEDLRALDEALESLDGRTLVVAGGDGSVHAAVRSLWRAGTLHDTSLGLVPLGTGNDLAAGLQVPDDPVAAASLIIDGAPRVLDLITTDHDEVVVNASHAGLGASAAGESDRFKERLGPFAYPLGALLAGVKESGWDLQVSLDGDPIHEGSVLMVGVANGPSIGGGTRLCPPALPDDGRLDLIVVSAVTAAARVAFGVALRDGVHLDREDVVHLRGRTATIAGEAVPHDLDGEVTEERTSCTYTVQARAWRMLLAPTDGD